MPPPTTRCIPSAHYVFILLILIISRTICAQVIEDGLNNGQDDTVAREFEPWVKPYLCSRDSCLGRCDSSEPHPRAGCYCDRQCSILSDCCPDYEASCLQHRLADNSDPWEMVRRRPANLRSCKRLHVNEAVSQYYLVVAKCKDGSTDKHAQLCENSRSLVADMPVINGQVIFANVHCALCNGYQRYKPMGISLSCEKRSYDVYRYYIHHSRQEFLHYINSDRRCTMYYLLDLSLEPRNSCDRMYVNATAIFPGVRQPKYPQSYACQMCSRYRFEFGSSYFSGARYANTTAPFASAYRSTSRIAFIPATKPCAVNV